MAQAGWKWPRRHRLAGVCREGWRHSTSPAAPETGQRWDHLKNDPLLLGRWHEGWPHQVDECGERSSPYRQGPYQRLSSSGPVIDGKRPRRRHLSDILRVKGVLRHQV